MSALESEVARSPIAPGSVGVADGDYGRRKRAGAFFTPPAVARVLAERAVAHLEQSVRERGPTVCDPFVGEGVLLRAIGAAMAAAGGSIDRGLLYGADLDPAHIEAARRVAGHVGEVDTLLTPPREWPGELGRVVAGGGFDLVATNPPWEKLRVNDREFFSRWVAGLGSLSRAERDRECDRLLQQPDVAAAYATYRARIEALGHAARRDYTTTGSGGDLEAYKLAVERSIELLRPGGVAALIVPHGVLGDWGARLLREWLWANHAVIEVIRFETGPQMFPEIHANLGVVLLFVRRGAKGADTVRVSAAVRTPDALANPPGVDVPLGGIRRMTKAAMVPLVEDEADLTFLEVCSRFPALGDWPPERCRPRREVDMTLDRSRFGPVGSGVPLLEGKNLQPYRLGLAPRKWDWTGATWTGGVRVAWRAVADRAMRRRLVAAWVPPNVALGNSLIATSAEDVRDLLWLLAWMNSRVAEAQLRLWSANNNINLHHLRALRAPLRGGSSEDDRIVALAAAMTAALAPGWDLPRDVAGMAAASSDAVAELDELWRRRYGLDEALWQRAVQARTAAVTPTG